MVDRVSTYNITQTTLRNAISVQADLTKLQGQISSGDKSQTFDGLDGNAQAFTALDNRVQTYQQFTQSNTLAQSNITASSKVLDNVIQIAQDFKNLIQLRRNTTLSGGTAFGPEVDNYWQSFSAQLNTSFEGSYLFSGTRTDTPPINTSSFPTLAVDGTPDTGYYQGNGSNVTLRIQDNQTVTSNVRADDEGIQKIFAALVMAKEGDGTQDDTKLQQAYDFMQQGIDRLTTVQSQVNDTSVTIDKTNSLLTSLGTYWKGVKEDLSNTDLVSASTKLAQDQGVLQAAFQAFARINSLHLTDYLR